MDSRASPPWATTDVAPAWRPRGRSLASAPSRPLAAPLRDAARGRPRHDRRRRRPRSSPARPARPGRPWRCPARRSARGAAPATSGARPGRGECTAADGRHRGRGEPPRPSPSSSSSPTRSRCTSAAWWPSGPSRRTSAPSPGGSPSTRKSGGLTGQAWPLNASRIRREEAALLGQLGDLLAAGLGELAQHPLLLRRRAWSGCARRGGRTGRRGRRRAGAARPCRGCAAWTPGWVPDLTSSDSSPSSVLIVSRVPSAAAVIGTVTRQCRSSPLRE